MLPTGYNPTQDPVYMSPEMLAYFRLQLLRKRQEALTDLEHGRRGAAGTLHTAEQIDMASESSTRYEALDKGRRAGGHIKKIDEALGRIESGEYGYCEQTGEEIGVARLMARPEATLCIEAKEAEERVESLHSGRFEEVRRIPARRAEP